MTQSRFTTAATIVAGAAALAMIFAPKAHAQDTWTGPDKSVHFAVSAVLGVAAINQWPDRPMLAWGVAMVPGVLKEVSDRSTTGFSGKDLAANALGAAVGVGLGGWIIQRQRGATVVAYSVTANLF